MRGLTIAALLLAGCDGVWDLEHLERPDASGLPADLAAWFPMETAAGGKVIDLAGPHDGVCAMGECPAMTTGMVGDALVFDGTSHVINAPSSAALDTRRSFTVAFWLRLDREPVGAACPVNKLFLGPVFDNTWQFCTTSGNWWFYGSPAEVAGPPIAVGKWQHLAATWNQATGELHLYQNGFAIGQPAITDLLFDAGRIVIGADVDMGQTLVYFPGALDELRIYTRALTADEVRDVAVNP